MTIYTESELHSNSTPHGFEIPPIYSWWLNIANSSDKGWWGHCWLLCSQTEGFKGRIQRMGTQEKEARRQYTERGGASHHTSWSKHRWHIYLSGKKDHISSLIKQRTQILKDREESWRLRSRAIWLEKEMTIPSFITSLPMVRRPSILFGSFRMNKETLLTPPETWLT